MLMQSWPLLAQMPRTAPRTARPETGAGQHEQGVLAAELHGAVLELRRGLRRHDLAGRRGTREHEEVGAIDERRAELDAAAGDYLQEPGRQSRLGQQCRRPQGA